MEPRATSRRSIAEGRNASINGIAGDFFGRTGSAWLVGSTFIDDLGSQSPNLGRQRLDETILQDQRNRRRLQVASAEWTPSQRETSRKTLVAMRTVHSMLPRVGRMNAVSRRHVGQKASFMRAFTRARRFTQNEPALSASKISVTRTENFLTPPPERGRSPPAARRSVEVVWSIPEPFHQLCRCGPGRSAVRRWRFHAPELFAVQVLAFLSART